MQIREATAIDLNAGRISQLANMLPGWKIPVDREDILLTGFNPLEIGNFFLLLVAICHQTSPRNRAALEGVVNGRKWRGWDFLLHRLHQAAFDDRSLLNAERWQGIRASDLLELYGPLLTDVEGRAELIRDLGTGLLNRGWNCANALYDEADGRIADGSANLLDLLAEFRAYSDPVRKKSYFFLALMRNAGLWSYSDPQNLGPPVDYHEVRGHLRVGTVRIQDHELRDKLERSQDVSSDEDVLIRRAVHDAIMRISAQSGIDDPSRLHYLFWNVFRSHCTREDPNCFGDRESALPDAYRQLAFVHGNCACPFSTICESSRSESRLKEHVIETDYY
jgi:hypothetical protein